MGAMHWSQWLSASSARYAALDDVPVVNENFPLSQEVHRKQTDDSKYWFLFSSYILVLLSIGAALGYGSAKLLQPSKAQDAPRLVWSRS